MSGDGSVKGKGPAVKGVKPYNLEQRCRGTGSSREKVQRSRVSNRSFPTKT